LVLDEEHEETSFIDALEEARCKTQGARSTSLQLKQIPEPGTGVTFALGSVSPRWLIRRARGCEARIHFWNPPWEAKMRRHFASNYSPPLERAQCQRPSYSSWVQPCSTSRWAYFDVPCFKGDRETG
jgi:hypothetical protein